MSVSRRAPHAPGGPIIAVVLGLVLALPASTHASTPVPDPGTGWHGRAIHSPHHHRPRTTSSGGALVTLAPGRGLTSPHGSRAVRGLQRQLTQLGYRPGPIDGRYGPRTRDAITWFQTKHGLTPTGTATATTRRHLHRRTTDGATPARPATATDHATTTPQPIQQPPIKASSPDPAPLNPAALQTILLLLAAAGLTVALTSYRRTRRRLAAAIPAPQNTTTPPTHQHPPGPLTAPATHRPKPTHPATDTTTPPSPPTIDAGPRSGAALDAAFASTTPRVTTTAQHDTPATTTRPPTTPPTTPTARHDTRQPHPTTTPAITPHATS